MTDHPRFYTALVISSTLLVAACAAPNGRFPSLERRPYETDKPLSEPVTAESVAPASLSEELARKVADIVQKHRTANAAFNKALPPVQAIAARAAGSSPGTESWVNAHLQLSRLDKERADSVAALGEFDALISAQIDGDSAYIDLLTEAQLQIAREVGEQTSEIGRLSHLIGE